MIDDGLSLFLIQLYDLKSVTTVIVTKTFPHVFSCKLSESKSDKICFLTKLKKKKLIIHKCPLPNRRVLVQGWMKVFSITGAQTPFKKKIGSIHLCLSLTYETQGKSLPSSLHDILLYQAVLITHITQEKKWWQQHQVQGSCLHVSLNV